MFVFIQVGHLHPVLVHLPVGILILAFILQWVDWKNKDNRLQPAITISLLVGMISAVVSCITGYLLSLNGDYDAGAIGSHQWMGIATAFISVIAWLIYNKNNATKWRWPVMMLLLLCIVITGHLGGSLTHGSGYLAQIFSGEAEQVAERKPIPDVQEALVYADVIQPLLQEKCYSCHNAKKKKGGLRLDDSLLMMKGGKDGIVIVTGNAEESELVKRLLLPAEDEDHMPPKEKSQLKEHDIALLHWWINSGTSFQKKVKELEQPDAIKPALLALQQEPGKKSTPDIPEQPVSKADAGDIHKLLDAGVVVLPVAANSNYLLANFVTVDSVNMDIINLLRPLKQQLIWLKIGDTNIGDDALAVIGQCKKLTRLQLDHTNITDKGLAHLAALPELRYLNLVATKVTSAGVKQLTGLTNLHSLYLYQTGVSKENWQELEKQFPNTKLDSGGYIVPLLESDTTVLKYNPSN